MSLKTIEEFKTESAAEIENERPLYAQVNNERREFTESEYETAINDRANSKFNQQNNGYKDDRLNSFKSVGDQLDELFWDIDGGKFGADAKKGEWYKAIKKIKDDNPKPA